MLMGVLLLHPRSQEGTWPGSQVSFHKLPKKSSRAYFIYSSCFRGYLLNASQKFLTLFLRFYKFSVILLHVLIFHQN